MNNAKITVPPTVANAIAHYVSLADSKHEAFMDILRLGYEAVKSEIILRHFEHDYDELMEALIRGYQIEKTPKEKVREYYDDLYVTASNFDPGRLQYKAECKAEAVVEMLDILGIKVAGINA